MKRLLTAKALLVALALFWGGAQAVVKGEVGVYGGVVREVYPGDDFRSIISQMQPGDELVFHEGEYRESYYRTTYGYNTLLYIAVSGSPDKPLVFRGYGNGEKRPAFIYDIPLANLCEIWGNNIELRYMEFQPIAGSGRGVRIGGSTTATRSNILIENSVFRGSVANSIDANSGNSVYDNIRVLNNSFIGIKYTGLYIGEHSGTSPVTNFVFAGNYLDASQVNRNDIVGYGMELKLNVKGAIVTNNIMINSQGPGIMVYGTTGGDPSEANILEGNIIAGARSSAGILVGAGPSVVKNNMVVGCPGGGIRAYDYGSRGLLRNVSISGNTAAANSLFGFRLSSTPYVPQNVFFTDNIAISTGSAPGFLGLPAESTGNQEVVGDSELEALIASLRSKIPADYAPHKVLPHLNKLKHGPFSMSEVKYLVEKVVQKLN